MYKELMNNIELTSRFKLSTLPIIKGILPRSPIVREGKKYFTFSPYLDTEENFKKKNLDCGIYFKAQTCIRYINNSKLDLTCPLSLNTQVQYCFQSYKKDNQRQNLSKILSSLIKLFNLDINNIIIKAPLSLKGIIDDICNIKLEFENECSFISDLKNNSENRYIKVYYKYYDMLCVFFNIVLVDIDYQTGKSQLDSIVFQERLHMINEKCKYPFQREIYKPLINKLLDEYDSLSPYQIHRLSNDILTIAILISNDIKLTNKGIGSEIKRKIKALTVFSEYYCNHKISGDGFINSILSIQKIENLCTNLELTLVAKNYLENCIKQNENFTNMYLGKIIKQENIDKLIHSEGVPKEIFGYRKSISDDIYRFDLKDR
ncbi:hypothetical protein ACTNDN_06750 [Niallia sp. HCP3S3_B10]|uniref:hypothetical protein n=1 Tax=Niallia sp. HCP3S3_B10 TaxID=3438944 RepID=UPI003F8AD353